MGIQYNGHIVSNPCALKGKAHPGVFNDSTSPYRVFFGNYNLFTQELNQNMTIDVREPGYELEASQGLGCGATIVYISGLSGSSGPNSIIWTMYKSTPIKWMNNIVPNQCHDGTRRLRWLIAIYYLNNTAYGVATLINY